jgi:hypothetical protein
MKLINFEKRKFIIGKLQGKEQIDFQYNILKTTKSLICSTIIAVLLQCESQAAD